MHDEQPWISFSRISDHVERRRNRSVAAPWLAANREGVAADPGARLVPNGTGGRSCHCSLCFPRPAGRQPSVQATVQDVATAGVLLGLFDLVTAIDGADAHEA